MMKLAFLCHDHPAFLNQAEPLLRIRDKLMARGISLTYFKSPSVGGRPERFWPKCSVQEESSRRNQAAKVVDRLLDTGPDMVLAHHRAVLPELLRSGVPLVVMEHTDGPSLEWSRYFIELPQVVGIIKGTVFTDLSNYNAPCCEGMFHGTLMNDLGLPEAKPIKTVKDLSKIELGYSFGAFHGNRRFLSQVVAEDRPIEISFVGGVVYPRSRLVSRHRKKALVAVGQLPNSYSKDGGLSQREYDQILQRSMTCLSPFGYGACYRSFESLYAGSVCIQPDNTYVKSWPNVYLPGETYIQCEADFADLEEKVNHVVSRWKGFFDWRRRNRQLLIDHYWNDDVLAQHMMEIFTRCFQRCA